MSFLRKLKGSKHFLKKGDNFLTNIEENSFADLNQRNLIVYHIDSETEGTFSLTVKNDDLGDTVTDRVCNHYNLHEYKEYFGLKYTLVDDNGDHEILWLDSNKQIGKQMKNTNNVLTFRVKHFPGKPQCIESEYVRYLIFLQIRNYLLKGDLQLALSDDIKLASYAVQASLGDYEPEIHKGNYLADIKFLSRKSFTAEEKIIEFHKKLKGKTPAEMELAFLETASQFDTYGAELIVVKTSKGVPINFGVSHNGIITYLHGTPANIAKIDMFPWSQIGKISYEGRTIRVHFHTPDRQNSEIIKKQVMVFRCTNSRVCKHLWKFILEQKAFFNFKRGVDVPRIKSSSRLFSLKSKFRFSGRCEQELISEQSIDGSIYSSHGSESSFNGDTSYSTNRTSLNRSGVSELSSSTVTTDHNFKRRTFMQTPRSFVRPKNIPKFQSTTLIVASDTNNNEVIVNNTSLESTPLHSPVSERHVNVHDPDSTLLDQSEQALKESSAAVVVVVVDTPAQATSTPHLTHKANANVDEIDSNQLNCEEVNSTSKKASLVKKISLNSEDSSNDEFYEHDYFQRKSQATTEPSAIATPISDTTFTSYKSSNSSYDQSIIKPDFTTATTAPLEQQQPTYATKLKNISCSLLIVVSILCIFFFFLILIEHWKCSHLIKSSSSSNCNDQKTLTNTLHAGFMSIKSRLFNESFQIDPIIDSFFNQFKED